MSFASSTRAVARVLRKKAPNEAARGFYAHLGFDDASRMLRAPVDRLLAD